MKLQELKEHDVRQICRDATIEVAEALKIEFPKFRDNVELEKLIRAKDENLFDLLNKFNLSYFNYFYFCKGVASQNKRNDLNEKESNLICNYIQEKDLARKSLLDELKKHL